MGLNLTLDYTYIRVPVLVYSRPPSSKYFYIGYYALDMMDHVGLLSHILLSGRKCIVICSKCIETPPESKLNMSTVKLFTIRLPKVGSLC